MWTWLLTWFYVLLRGFVGLGFVVSCCFVVLLTFLFVLYWYCCFLGYWFAVLFVFVCVVGMRFSLDAYMVLLLIRVCFECEFWCLTFCWFLGFMFDLVCFAWLFRFCCYWLGGLGTLFNMFVWLMLFVYYLLELLLGSCFGCLDLFLSGFPAHVFL